MQLIPRTLVHNFGDNTIKTLTRLRKKYVSGEYSFGIGVKTGTVTNMKDYGVENTVLLKCSY